jgi:hypothetical protein
VQIDVARTVAAHPREAFATISDVLDWPLIIRSVKSVELLYPGQVREGALLRVTRRIFGREATQELEIVRMAAPREFRLSIKDPDMHFELDHVIDALFGGGSRLMLIFRSRGETRVGKTLHPFMTPYMGIVVRDELEEDLADLAAAISLKSMERSGAGKHIHR